MCLCMLHTTVTMATLASTDSGKLGKKRKQMREYWHLTSVHENHRTCRIFPMARPKCPMRDFTNLNKIHKTHRTNVWWIMKVFRVHWFNIMSSGDVICWHWSGSTLAQVMAYYLMAPNRYQNQCWQVIRSYGNFKKRRRNAQDIYPRYEFQNLLFKITAASPRANE